MATMINEDVRQRTGRGMRKRGEKEGRETGKGGEVEGRGTGRGGEEERRGTGRSPKVPVYTDSGSHLGGLLQT
jgi:hypothetical protein